MENPSPFLAVQEVVSHIKPGDIWEFAEICLIRTSEALHATRCGSPIEISQAVALAREAHVEERPVDLIEVFARAQGYDEEHLSPVILELGNRVASTLTPYTPFVPFAGKLIAPSAFYDSFDHLHKVARILLSPVIYAEDTDAIGIASANPIACELLSEEIRATVFKRFGIRPFVSCARLDYESWCFLTRKHFEI